MEGYGDRLARGAASATFAVSDGKITQEKWDAAFKDIDEKKTEKKNALVEANSRRSFSA
jgi:hypothetical protein